MGRKLVESSITTRAARASLKAGLYWRGIDPEIHLGYRKAIAGGKWLVRYYVPALKTYRRIELGIADDAVSEGTLSFNAALRSARAAVEKARRGAEMRFDLPVGTVRSVVRTYMAALDARESGREGRLVRSSASLKLQRHVLDNPPLAELRLDELSDEHLTEWVANLGNTLKVTSRRRIASDLRAALNVAYRSHRKHLPKDFAEIVRIGLRVESPVPVDDGTDIVESLILTDDQVRAIVTASFNVDKDGDFGRLVLCLAATGARFSQIKRMKVRDVQAGLQRLMVPRSRKGKNKAGGYTPVRVGPDVINALSPVTHERESDEPLLCRWRHIQTGPVEWKRDSRAPWKTPSEMKRPWVAACRAAGVAEIVPYALRHSSIVRGIREGLPIRLVAAIHDTSVAMIERHYARWIADGLEELAARAVVPILNPI